MSYEIDEYPDFEEPVFGAPVDAGNDTISASSHNEAKDQMEYNRILQSMTWFAVSAFTMKCLNPSGIFWQAWRKRKGWMKAQGFEVHRQDKKWMVCTDIQIT